MLGEFIVAHLIASVMVQQDLVVICLGGLALEVSFIAILTCPLGSKFYLW
ncbi:hypothetical protein VIC_001409 [Vibrio coralliilyticus ATCC BAA-450]|nr:hypothetical protein VIC_001409 [Vibrio coralliilyticus ATCC BAA-450]